LAAASVLVNITLVAILPGIGLGLSATTLVGQALGKKDPDDAYRWGIEVVKVGVLTLGSLGLPMLLIPDVLLKGFIYDPVTLELASMPMRVVGAGMGMEAIGLVLMHALLGAGDTKRVMIVGICCQWLVFLPLAYLVGPALNYGLLAVWTLQMMYRALQMCFFYSLWRGGKWRRIKV